MLGIECVVRQGDRVLLARNGAAGLTPAHLGPIVAVPRHGESPIAACFRAVQEQTSWRLSPSCAAVILEGAPGGPVDYRLAFVADLPPSARPQRLPRRFVWLDVSELSSRHDIPAIERQLLPQILRVGVPISVVLETDTSVQPAVQRLGEIAPIEPARLSPLVFATTN